MGVRVHVLHSLFENTLRQEQRAQSLTRAALVVRKYSASRAKSAKPDQS